MTSRPLNPPYKSALLLALLAGCGGSSGGAGPTPQPVDYRWSHLGPAGGFVSSVAFDPTIAGTVWVSGDDGSGLFRSTDAGATWDALSTTPRDQSTYSLTFDPADNLRLYAPNHFGRGFLGTTDGGATWALEGAGLPNLGTPSRFDDMAIDASDPATIFACTASGLLRSTDFGATFSPIVSATFGVDTEFTSAASSGAGVFVGSSTGRVYRSIDSGVNWTEVTASPYLPVSAIALTTGALYAAFLDGTIIKTDSFTTANLSILNTGGGGDVIDSGLWTRLAVISGASAATDIVYVGTVAKAANSLWGFHVSFDGGATFERHVTGMDGASVFSMAVDPFDSMSVIVGTIGLGVYRTSNAGLQWTSSSTGIHAAAPLAIAEDAGDSNHLIISSTESFNATPGVFETFDGGTTWSVASAVPVDALSLDIHPSTPSIILAGSFNENAVTNPGIHRSTAGTGGPWSVVLATEVQIERFIRTSTALFAVGTQVSGSAGIADLGVYRSLDDGATWSLLFNQLVTNVVPHPSTADHAVAVGEDVWATLDSFATAPQSVGLMAFAPGEIFTSAAFVSATRLLVGSSTGRLFVTNSYDASGSGVVWVEVSTPADGVNLRDIHVTSSAWYLACFTGDFLRTATSTPGVLRSLDEGATWQFLDGGMGSSRLVWSLQRRPGPGTRFLASMWGGGVLALEDL